MKIAPVYEHVYVCAVEAGCVGMRSSVLQCPAVCMLQCFAVCREPVFKHGVATNIRVDKL